MSYIPKFQTLWNSIIKNKILFNIVLKQGFYLMFLKSRLVKYSLRYTALRQMLHLQERLGTSYHPISCFLGHPSHSILTPGYLAKKIKFNTAENTRIPKISWDLFQRIHLHQDKIIVKNFLQLKISTNIYTFVSILKVSLFEISDLNLFPSSCLQLQIINFIFETFELIHDIVQSFFLFNMRMIWWRWLFPSG